MDSSSAAAAAAAAVGNNNNGELMRGHDDIMSWFEEVSEKAEIVQRQTLVKILEMNHGVEYLKKWFGEIDVLNMEETALESLFTCLVPLSSHADLEPFIQRIADGDDYDHHNSSTPLITHEPIKLLSLRYSIIHFFLFFSFYIYIYLYYCIFFISFINF